MKAYHSQRLVEEMHAEQLARGLPTPPAKVVAAPAPPTPAVPKGKVRRGLPICVECVMHSVRFEWITGKITHRCHDPMTRDPVTGAPTDPTFNRRNALSCGPQGSYWQAKPPQPERRVERDVDDSEPMEFVPPVPVLRLAHRPADDCIAVLWQPGIKEPT